ncbi:hypothetical protein AMTRI_Chr09g34270 [Amborella trichopoda]|uniref:Strictosidine synthase conserved region domain-containing protein n=1 Tax=Amborella trichopoda TaxID=13333 RepID=W1NL35_AMBTC|nr:protein STRICTOSIDINE SYNTHASE-LIKE 6 [Amborella trichopoda]ERM96166.1 hypothetical protein AMTR_s00001p00067420 [Amborella trichopoda]|eukprot:XP_006828750.1 protein STRICTOSIDINE SYNTHASE-LIKE 6 [Amborella trichopoda]
MAVVEGVKKGGGKLLAPLIAVAPVVIVVALWIVEPFDTSPIPDYDPEIRHVREQNLRVARDLERVAEGLVMGPEDLAYDAQEGAVYVTTADGWVKKVEGVAYGGEIAVRNLSFTGGRPLGVALGPSKEVFVCDAYKGLLKVADNKVEVLSDGAEGVKFKLADGLDVASDGTIYFTDASYKYDLDHHMLDIFEGRPHGRLLRFEPSTGETHVLLKGLYFANGLALSPNQDFLVYCESTLARCVKYWIEGDKKGSTEIFIDKLPGVPDNIRYDGEGRFWIGLATGKTAFFNIMLKYAVVRKAMVIVSKFIMLPEFQMNGGVLAVSLTGEAIALYSDPELSKVTGGIKIGKYLYIGYLDKSYIGRLDLKKYAASAH